MQLHSWSAKRLATEPLPGPSAVLRIADDESLLTPIFDHENAIRAHKLLFWDTEQGSEAPCREHAERILTIFSATWEHYGIEHIVVQCQAGIGRSVAVCMALSQINGYEYKDGYSHGQLTYNRKLYRELMNLGGRLPAEPLVSITVRVKYDLECLDAFLYSIRRQRYDNWECIAFTDGPNPDAISLAELHGDRRIRVIETPYKRGRWGHPYRQMAFEQCKGEWIGTQNDDNYLTPGFIEQLVASGQAHNADIVCCQPLHRYWGWKATDPGTDLCTWIAKRWVIEQVPWTRTDFEADREYFNAMLKVPGAKAMGVTRPLVVKN